jgi:hypothetical protein
MLVWQKMVYCSSYVHACVCACTARRRRARAHSTQTHTRRAITHRAISTSVAASNAPHTAARAHGRTHRHRPGSRQDSKYKPRMNRQATARMRTSRARDNHASNARRDALTALRDALDRRSRLRRPREHLVDGTATVVPQRGPRGGRKLRSGVDHGMVKAPESTRDDNAPRDRRRRISRKSSLAS